MRSLFAKLFLGAATIILLSMAITLALAFFSSSGPVKMHRKHVHSREKALIYDLLGIYGHQAMDTLLDKGPEALAEPARTVIIIAVSTGPSSRMMPMPRMFTMNTSAPKLRNWSADR